MSCGCHSPSAECFASCPRFENCDFVLTGDGKRQVGGFSHLKRQLNKAIVAVAGKRPASRSSRNSDFTISRRSVTTWSVRNGADSIIPRSHSHRTRRWETLARPQAPTISMILRRSGELH